MVNVKQEKEGCGGRAKSLEGKGGEWNEHGTEKEQMVSYTVYMGSVTLQKDHWT